MAIIACPECHGQVSDQAQFCPHCGYPIEQRIKGAGLSEQDNIIPDIEDYEPAETPHAAEQTPYEPITTSHDADRPQYGAPAAPVKSRGSKAKEGFMALMMLVVIVAVGAYFIVPYFTETTPTDHEVVMPSDEGNVAIDDYEPVPETSEPAKPSSPAQNKEALPAPTPRDSVVEHPATPAPKPATPAPPAQPTKTQPATPQSTPAPEAPKPISPKTEAAQPATPII